MTDLISDSAHRLFSQFVETSPSGTDEPVWSDALWQAVEEAGFPLALLSEDEGGFGLPPSDGLDVVRIAGRKGIDAPVGDTMIANLLLARAGLPLAEGPATMIGVDTNGQPVAPVAWGRYLQTLVLYSDSGDGTSITRINVGTAAPWKRGRNLADAPRDALPVPAELPAESNTAAIAPGVAMALGALVRVMQIAGALEIVLEMSAAYASERVQFGRPIAKFQAIQQNLAVMAGEAAAAGAAATMAAQALNHFNDDQSAFRLIVAAAKIRAGEASGIVAELSHQIHGAIGFSREYALHPMTRRLWSWRDEYGGEAEWAESLGASVADLSTGGLWPAVTKAQSGLF